MCSIFLILSQPRVYRSLRPQDNVNLPFFIEGWDFWKIIVKGDQDFPVKIESNLFMGKLSIEREVGLLFKSFMFSVYYFESNHILVLLIKALTKKHVMLFCSFLNKKK